MTRLQKVGPEVRLNQRGRDLMAGSQIFRKKAVMLQDVPLDDDVDPETKKLISKLQAGISIKNNVSGDKVNFNQDLAQINQLVKRIAVSNKIKGNDVNTKQNIKEFNSKRKLSKFEEKLRDVTEALKNVASSEQNNDENGQQVTKAFQRLAVQNNIKGNKVNTKQEIEEHNDELVAATALAVMKIVGEKPTNIFSADDLSDIETALRRLAIKNDITGVTVNTKQDIKEYNEELVKTIAKALRRLAVKNDISGDKVNTDMKVTEVNDNPVQALSDALQRLAVSNKISGKVVNTEQDISEVNNDEPDSFASQDDSKVLAKIIKPFKKMVKKAARTSEKSQKDDQLYKKVQTPAIIEDSKSNDDSKAAEDELFQAQQDYIGNGPRSLYFAENPVNLMLENARNIRTYEGQLQAQRIELLKRLQPNLFMDEAVTSEDELGQGSENEDADEVDDDNDEEDSDDEEEALSQTQQDESPTGNLRRMTINNNVSQETRRLMIDNKIQGKTVNTKQNATEFNSGLKKIKLPEAATQVPANVIISQPAVTSKPKKGNKKIICKTKDGKKIITKADLSQLLELLEKMKASRKNSNVIEESSE